MKFRKALADLRQHPVRILLLWLSLCLGTAVVTAAFGARAVLDREIQLSYNGADPAAVIVWTDDVEVDDLAAAQQVAGVVAADARRLVRARVEIRPGDWRALRLYGVRDFSDLRVSKVYPVAGAWPPGPAQAVVERSALEVLDTHIGGRLRIRVPGQTRVQELLVSGVSHDPAQAPGWQDNVGYAYVTVETLRQIGVGRHLDELRLDVEGDRAVAEDVARRVQTSWHERGETVHRVEVPPRRHPHADHMGTSLLLLQVLSALVLLLSGLLAANLISATIARQTRQVGIMKTLGASRSAIAAIYLQMVAMVALSALVLGAPLGIVLAHNFSAFAAVQLNLVVDSLAVPPLVLVAIAVAGLGVPILAAAVPIWQALRMTARQAVRQVGPETWQHKPRTADRRWLSRPSIQMSLRNTFRRPARLWLTLCSLALGGAMLMTAANVYGSLVGAVDNALDARGDDIEVRLLRPVPATALRQATAAVNGVEAVEIWGAVLAGIELPDHGAADLRDRTPAGLVAGRYGVLAPPAGDVHPGAAIIQGHWPRDQSSIIEVAINRQLDALEPSLALGSEVVLRVGDRRSRATLVGVVEEIAPATMYVTPAGMTQLTGVAHHAGALRLVTEDGRATQVAGSLEAALVADGWFLSYLMTRHALREAMVDHFMILLVVLTVIASSALLVGVLGLATTMSLNVMERSREIGVIRAMGAPHGRVHRLVLVEGAAITGLSLILACLLMVPLTLGVGYIVGQHGLHVGLPLMISSGAILGWCIIAAAATWLACYWPARQASARSVHELIAYE